MPEAKVRIHHIDIRNGHTSAPTGERVQFDENGDADVQPLTAAALLNLEVSHYETEVQTITDKDGVEFKQPRRIEKKTHPFTASDTVVAAVASLKDTKYYTEESIEEQFADTFDEGAKVRIRFLDDKTGKPRMADEKTTAPGAPPHIRIEFDANGEAECGRNVAEAFKLVHPSVVILDDAEAAKAEDSDEADAKDEVKKPRKASR